MWNIAKQKSRRFQGAGVGADLGPPAGLELARGHYRISVSGGPARIYDGAQNVANGVETAVEVAPGDELEIFVASGGVTVWASTGAAGVLHVLPRYKGET